MTSGLALADNATIIVHYASPLQLSHAIQLVTAIISRGQSSPEAPKVYNSSKDEGSQNIIRWRIQNKYYTADVGFRLVDGTVANELIPAVIVLSLNSEDSIAIVKRLLSFYKENEPEIALLATYNQLPQSNIEKKTSEDAWEDLAYEHGFEWVTIDSIHWENSVSLSDSIPSNVEEDMENGVGRIVAALHANLWEDMKLSKARSKESGECRKVDSFGDAVGSPSMSISTQNDFTEDELEMLELSAAAPPLPPARPFVPTPMTFPQIILPLIKKKSTSHRYDEKQSSSSIFETDEQLKPWSPCFEDQFSPFEQGFGEKFSSLHLTHLHSSGNAGSEQHEILDINSHSALYPEEPFPTAATLSRGIASIADADEILDDREWTELFQNMKGFRKKAETMNLEERHTYAEQFVASLSGNSELQESA